MASSSSPRTPDAASWSDLPGDVLCTVAALLPSIFDLLQFRSVCRSWRAAAAYAPPPLPYLMFSEKGGADASARRGFYSLSDGKVHWVRLPEEAGHWRCCGSSHGWLAMVGLDAVVRLLNPISGAQLELPPLTTLPQVLHVVTDEETDNYGGEVYGRPSDPGDYTYPWYVVDTHEGYPCRWTTEDLRDDYVQKAVASPPATSSGCTVMILYDDYKVAYARPGEDAWTSLWSWSSPWYEDLVHHGDKFYLLTWEGTVRTVDFAGAAPGGPPSRVEEYAPRNESRLSSGGRSYLSVTRPRGEIVLVWRHLQRSSDFLRTERFDAWKLEVNGRGEKRWVAMESLGGSTLFLSNECLAWVSCTSTMGSGGGRSTADCIYFIADNMEFGVYDDSECVFEVGVYHVEEGMIERLLPNGCDEIKQYPIWITPSL